MQRFGAAWIVLHKSRAARRFGKWESFMSIVTRPDITWFHSFDLGDGEAIDGIKPYDVLSKEADIIFAEGVAGKSVLDIGAWDGFFSFEAEKRGASRVVATDHFCWSGEGWGNRLGFDYMHALLNSNVESIDVDVNQFIFSILFRRLNECRISF